MSRQSDSGYAKLCPVANGAREHQPRQIQVAIQLVAFEVGQEPQGLLCKVQLKSQPDKGVHSAEDTNELHLAFETQEALGIPNK